MKSVLTKTFILFSAVMLLSAPALGKTKYVLEVKGLSCPFCAYGLEKKLKNVENVESVTISMQQGQATVVAKEGTEIAPDDLRKAVKEAGFSLGSVKKVESEAEQAFIRPLCTMESSFQRGFTG